MQPLILRQKRLKETRKIEREERPLGLVQVYTGAGKGKTTASLGLALRAIGHGYRVLMVQFLKQGGYTGEFLSKNMLPNLEILQFWPPCEHAEGIIRGEISPNECVSCFDPKASDTESARKAMEASVAAARGGNYDVVILDEINVAINKGLVSVDEVLKLMQEKSGNTELVLTGRSAREEIMEAADLVSEVKMIKHPFNKGIFGRRGIEY